MVNWRREGKRTWIASRSDADDTYAASLPQGNMDDKKQVDEDEAQYEQLFALGIYYTHMPFAQLSEIANDLCPTTKQPYTPEAVIRRALWDGMSLRAALSDPDNVTNLGITLDQFSLTKTPARTLATWADQRFFRVPEDETYKSGDSLGMLVSATNNLSDALSTLKVALDDAVADPADNGMGTSGLAAQRDLFAVPVPLAPTTPSTLHEDASRRGSQLSQRATEQSRVSSPTPSLPKVFRRPQSPITDSAPPEETWVPHEPIRFGVEFYAIDRLAERTRLYSPTIFYAGSWWNLYVVTVHKSKGIQLGIYLHRQNPQENVPAISVPRPQVSSQDITSASTTSGAPEPTERTTPSATIDLQDHLVVPDAPPKPYLDQRRSVRAYFSIHCFSPLGNGLTRFSSGPDQFTVSQSWGWKSSSLLGTVYLGHGTLGSATSSSANRFRCVCTIGLV